MSDREEFDKDEERILDLLARGLLREFPNPQRVAALIPPSLKASRFANCDWLMLTMDGPPWHLQPVLSGFHRIS